MWSFLIALVSRAEQSTSEERCLCQLLKPLKKMDQILSNTMEVCSFIIVSLVIVQNSYLTVSIALCTKTIYNYITLQKTCCFLM